LSRKGETISAWALLALQIAASAGQSVLICLSKSDGGFPYDASSVVCFQEGFKVLLTMSFEARDRRDLRDLWSLRRFRSASLAPAFMAALHSNLVFLAHLHLSPPIFHLLSLCRVIATGLLFRIVLRQQLVVIQWMGLLQLFLVMIGSSQIDPQNGEDRSGNPDEKWLAGMSLVLILAACSSLSSAHLLLRNQEPDLYLHLFGFLSSILLYALIGTKRPFEGYTWEVFLLVIINSLMSLVGLRWRKQQRLKIFGSMGSLVLATVFSWWILDFIPGGNFCRGVLLSAAALGLYYGDQKNPLQK